MNYLSLFEDIEVCILQVIDIYMAKKIDVVIDEINFTTNCSKYKFTIQQLENQTMSDDFHSITKIVKQTPLNNFILKTIIGHFGDDIIGKPVNEFTEIQG